MSTAIPIESETTFVIQELARLEHENTVLQKANEVLNANFLEAMTLYNKSEDELKKWKQINNATEAALDENHKENDWLRHTIQRNAKHHNKIISELAAEVLRKDAMMEHLR
jgi:hypothetical protein